MHNAADNFSYQFTQLCFCGHSHVPVAFSKRPIAMGARPIEEIPVWASADDGSDFLQADMIQIPVEQSVKYLINIGSVGQPRNRNPARSTHHDEGADHRNYDILEPCITDILSVLPYIIALNIPAMK